MKTALQVAMHAQNHIVLFENEEAAGAALKSFQERLAQGRWSKNREEEPTHTVNGMSGPATFVVEKVEAVVLIDIEVNRRMKEEDNEWAFSAKIEREKRWRETFGDTAQ